MLWAILFSLIFGKSDPVFVIPGIDNYVKKHVEDNERKDQLVLLIKESKKRRKKNNKTKNKFRKEFRKLNIKKSSSADDFMLLIRDYNKLRYQYQSKELDYILQSKALIKYDEWNKIIIAAREKDIQKEIKKTRKEIDNLKKQYNQSYKVIRRRLKDKADKETIIKIVETTYKKHYTYYNEYLKFLENKNSILYRHISTKTELKSETDKFNKLYLDIYKNIVEGHNTFVKLIEAKDIKRINKKAPDF